jgi:hypothetical protein
LPDYYQTFFRNYDQALGRFVAVDPLAEAAESLSGYQYSGNNPIMFNDPMGDQERKVDFPIPLLLPEINLGGGGSGRPRAGLQLNELTQIGIRAGEEAYLNLINAARKGDPAATAAVAAEYGTPLKYKGGLSLTQLFNAIKLGAVFTDKGTSWEITYFNAEVDQTGTEMRGGTTVLAYGSYGKEPSGAKGDLGSSISKWSNKTGEGTDIISPYQTLGHIGALVAENRIIGNAAASATRAYNMAYSRAFTRVGKVGNVLGAAGKILGYTGVVTSGIELVTEDFSYTNLAKFGLNVGTVFLKANPIGLGVSLTLGVLNYSGLTEKGLNYLFHENTIKKK